MGKVPLSLWNRVGVGSKISAQKVVASFTSEDPESTKIIAKWLVNSWTIIWSCLDTET